MAVMDRAEVLVARIASRATTRSPAPSTPTIALSESGVGTDLLPGEKRLSLRKEGRHALGVVGAPPRHALQLGLDLELPVEVVGQRGIQQSLGEPQAEGRLRREVK